VDSERARASYDALPYPGYPFPQSHPGRMAAQATLRGLDPPPVETARVLELGCGDGGNLVPMAFGLPYATFVGIDLNEAGLARGRALAQACGIKNVELRTGDLERLDPATLGAFDYLVAHGVYSWVSPRARDNLLALARGVLADHGVAYLSYNALPGGHLRLIARELMQFASRGETDAQRIVERARAAVRTVIEAQQPDDVYGRFLNEYLTKVLERSDAGLFHDDLELHNHHVYLEDLVAHAERHGLAYLAEGDLRESSFGTQNAELDDALDELEPGSEVGQEQALDFLQLRMYRQTLFCRAQAPRNDLPDRARVDKLQAYSPMRPLESGANLSDESRVTFEGKHGARLNTDHPAVKRTFAALGEVWPASRSAAELLGDDPDAVRQAILAGHAAGMVQLTTHAPPVAHAPGERPATTVLARAQAASGSDHVTSLKHERVPIADHDGRRLIELLDGTNDRAALDAVMHDSERLDASLTRLADLALLTTRREDAAPRAASPAS
jgi:SAM-dependent methyltransferase